MVDEVKEEKLPLVADSAETENPVIDLLRAACWEKPADDAKQAVTRKPKE